VYEEILFALKTIRIIIPDYSQRDANFLDSNFNSNKLTKCNSFTILLLDVLCRSICFGRLHAHHQELTTALKASGFTLQRGGSSVVGRGLVVVA
jgi:hypothetical protein